MVVVVGRKSGPAKAGAAATPLRTYSVHTVYIQCTYSVHTMYSVHVHCTALGIMFLDIRLVEHSRWDALVLLHYALPATFRS